MWENENKKVLFKKDHQETRWIEWNKTKSENLALDFREVGKKEEATVQVSPCKCVPRVVDLLSHGLTHPTIAGTQKRTK